MSSKETSTDEETIQLSRIVLLIMSLIIVNMTILGCKRKLSQRYPIIGKLLQDSTLTTIVGLCSGAFLQYYGKTSILKSLGDSYEPLFMIVMLPPIIFERYYSSNRNEISNFLAR